MKQKKIKTEVHEKNEIFKKLEENLSLIQTLSPSLKIETYTTSIASTVTTEKVNIIRFHASITFELVEFPNTLIRIASIGKDGLEITRVCVAEQYQGKKLGSYMMNTLFLYMIETLGYLPKIFLECVGSIQVGGCNYSNPIQQQTKFFRKFGFRVNVSKYYPQYVKMTLDSDKLNNLLFDEEFDLGLVA
jgi:ribosomal protein S18 acetylase RimI-like enzyme